MIDPAHYIELVFGVHPQRTPLQKSISLNHIQLLVRCAALPCVFGLDKKKVKLRKRKREREREREKEKEKERERETVIKREKQSDKERERP